MPTSRALIGAPKRFRCGVVGVSLLVVALVVSTGPCMAQEPIRVDGTVLWISGQTLTLALDGPGSQAYYAVGPYLVLAPGQRATVNVDLGRVAQSDYAAMRPNERIGVIGMLSSDRRRIIGTSIIREPEPQAF